MATWNPEMPNITLAMDERLILAARKFAKSEGTTLNALVRTLVTRAIDEQQRREESRKRLIKLMDNSNAVLPKGYKFNREALYESPSLSRHKRSDLRGSRKNKPSR
jgi:hypothetical protein